MGYGMDQGAMDNSDKRMKKCSKYKTVLTTLIRGARAEGWAKHRAKPKICQGITQIS
jgi:hypothetical protein